jgi:hypothetical protein
VEGAVWASWIKEEEGGEGAAAGAAEEEDEGGGEEEKEEEEIKRFSPSHKVITQFHFLLELTKSAAPSKVFFINIADIVRYKYCIMDDKLKSLSN